MSTKPAHDPQPRRLAERSPAPDDIQVEFAAALSSNPRTRFISVRGMKLAKVPLINQYELAAELLVFEDGGLALGKEYGFKFGAVLLWDGTSLEVRKVSRRPSDHYLIATVPRETGRPFFILLHRALAAAFHGIPRTPGLVVRHRRDLRHRTGAKDVAWGSHAENRLDFEKNRSRARSRDRVVLVKAKTARAAKVTLGVKGEQLNQLVEKLLRQHLLNAA